MRDALVLCGVLLALVGAVALAVWLWRRRTAALEAAQAEAKATTSADEKARQQATDAQAKVAANDNTVLKLTAGEMAARAEQAARQKQIDGENDAKVAADLAARGLTK